MKDSEDLIGTVINAIVEDVCSRSIKVKLSDDLYGDIDVAELAGNIPKIGDSLSIYVENIAGSIASVSHERALLLHTWDDLWRSHTESHIVEGLIDKKLPDSLGFRVSFSGVAAFLPAACMSAKQIECTFVGDTKQCIVSKFDRKRGEIEVKLA